MLPNGEHFDEEENDRNKKELEKRLFVLKGSMYSSWKTWEIELLKAKIKLT